MSDLAVEIAGLEFRNPILTAAGPTSRDGMALLNAAAGGAGGLVAKTVSVRPANVPKPNMAALENSRAGSRRGILNAELWSDIPLEQWLEREYAIALSSALPLIASVGYTPEEVSQIGPKIEEVGVHALEFSTHYVGGHVEIAKALREAVDIPIFAKLSPKVEVAEVAREVAPYVDGIVAINSFGPCLRINLETGRPLLGSEQGHGWMSGAAIRPLAIRCVADIAMVTDLPIIGVGGVTAGTDAIEFMMAGASAVEVCTASILEGHMVYGKIAGEMEEWLDTHGHDSMLDVKGTALKHIREPVELDDIPLVDLARCTKCGLCPKSCVYDAITVNKKKDFFFIDEEKCQRCGMCISVCPYNALSIGD